MENESDAGSCSDWPREYRHRGYDRDRYVATLLKRLAKYERDSDPARGAETEAGKDLKAFSALSAAGQLVEAVAGWALDHQFGLALRGLSFVPLQPSGTEKHSDYLEQRRAVDAHEHERLGAGAFRTVDIDPTIARKLLIGLLSANPGGFQYAVQSAALEALRALQYGEVLPLVEPAKEGRKAKYRELRLQLKALGFVQYRQTRGTKKHKAQEQVAEAYGVSQSTLNTWEYRLRNELGQLEVSRTLSFAHNSATLTEAAIRAAYKGGPPADHLSWENRYGDAALRKAADRYKEVMRKSRGQ